MTKRFILAAVLGGLAMFAWSLLAHLVLPRAYAGIGEIPNEQAVLGAMHSAIGVQHGMYIFPGFGLGPNPTRSAMNEAMKTYDHKLAVNPSGLLIYHPPGAKSMEASQLVTEFLTELLESLIVVILLLHTWLRGYLARVAFVALAGFMAGITTNIPYWNWYGFPGSYTVAYMTTEIVGYVVAGLVVAAILKIDTSPTPAAALAAAA